MEGSRIKATIHGADVTKKRRSRPDAEHVILCRASFLSGVISIERMRREEDWMPENH